VQGFPLGEGREGLSKEVGLLEALGLGVGTIIGGTIYSALGIASKETRGYPELAFGLSFIAALLVAKVYSDIVSRNPSSGGTYSVVDLGLGSRFSAPTALLQFFAYSVATAFYSWVFADYTTSVLGGDPRLVSVALILSLTFVLLLGAKESGRVTLALSVFKVSVLVALGVAALIVLGVAPRGPLPPLSSLAKAAFLVFLGFEGFEVIASASEEMHTPLRDVPLAMYGSIATVIVIYLLLSLTITSVITSDEKTALLALARLSMNGLGVALVLAGSMASTATASISSMYVSSRLLYRLAKDGRLPRLFSHTWRRGSPYVAVLAGTAASLAFALSGTTLVLIGWASLAFIVLFLLVSISGLRILEGKTVPLASLTALLLLAAAGLLFP
jgi:amino acid transporter